MPKINVYLPDDLAEAVKEAGVPVSAICQRALEQAVRRVTAIRETAVGHLDADDLAARLSHFTARARTALKLGTEQARAEGSPGAGTEHLLAGILNEGANLALQVLRAMEIEPERVARDLAGQSSTEAGAAAPEHLSGPAANALELAVTEAAAFGHNYVGCEHLLLGLIAEPDGTAGRVLRSLGAEPRLTRRAVAAALAGYMHLRAQTAPGPMGHPGALGTPAAPGAAGAAGPAADMASTLTAAVRQELRPLIERIKRLEDRVGVSAEA